MKTLYLHVGTHKTGTTSIQKWLHEQSAMLLDVGVLVPQMGRPFQNTSGHHNLAWELSGDPRFSEAYGTRRELFDELSSICHESVILSSEDFGCVSNKPDVLKSFLDEFRKNDYQVNLIVYLRDPIDYGVSLHGEYKKQLSFQDVTENASLDELRCKTDPRNFVSEITKAKSYHLRDALPCFQDFNYARLVGNYERAAGTENVFVRAYSHDVIDDFAALIGLQHLPGVGVIRENRSNLPDPEINSLKDALREQGPTASDEFKAFIAQRAVQLNDPLERIRPLLAPAVGFIPERLTDVQSWRGHLCFVPVIMQAVKPAVFVELGVHKGDSYSAFCQAAQSFNLNTRCYGVDTWEGDHQAGFYGDEIYSELKNYHDSRYSQFSELLRKTFDEASAFFENGNIDLLHIDGLHTYEAVKHDFESWLPKLSAKAVVLFHDTVVRHDDFGVWKFWSELENKYPSFQFFHSHGLGVLQVGKHLPDVFAKLSQLDARASSALRGAVYQQSRLVIQAKAEAEQAKAEAEQAKAEAEQAKAEAEQAKAEAEQAKAEAEQAKTQLAGILKSRSWRVTKPLRKTITVLRNVRAKLQEPDSENRSLVYRTSRKVYRTIPLPASFRPRLRLAAKKIFSAIESTGHGKTAIRGHIKSETCPTRYAAWLRFNTLSREEKDTLCAALDARKERLPRISVIMPTYNTPVHLLDRAIGSVLKQIYEDWELCIADDASNDERTVLALEAWSQRDTRIKVFFCAKNGNISRATNAAASLASGGFLAFLDHDDELSADALAEIAITVADAPDTDYVYSDDDKIDKEGRRFSPQFKPDWSPTLLLSYMYMGHVKVVRRSLFLDFGGFRVGFEGAQDYDFALRISERTQRIMHVPKVLYHWRVVPGSTAASGDAKPASFDAGRRAVAEALERRGIKADVIQPQWAIDARCGVYSLRFPDSGPKVSIIIPTRNNTELLRNCVLSLKQTTYKNYEVVIIDNASDDPETLAYLATLPHRVLHIANPPNGRFNFAYINNTAVKQVDGDYVLLLNNDTKVRTPEWLSQMMGYSLMENVGVVGARLLFGDKTVQHAGIVHGFYGGMAGPAFRNAPLWDNGYLDYAVVARECSAVTAACLLTPRALYLELGGLDEQNFAVAYNDVDYCYRVVDSGRRCIYAPGAELFHFEGKSRGFNDEPREVANFREHYSRRTDPWFNLNLSLDDEHFRVRPYHKPAHITRPVRAVMVTHNLNNEGAPNSQLELIVGLAKMGIIDPIVLSPVDGPLRVYYAEAGIEVRIIKLPLENIHTRDAFEVRQSELADILRDLDTEVVYANTLQTFWAIEAGERAGLPTIWNPRESEPWETYFDFLMPDLRDIAYKCFALPYRVIFVAHATRRAWAPVEQCFNFTVIHNGLDINRIETRLAAIDRMEARRALGIKPDEVAVVLVGTVCDRKGQIDLLRALQILSPQIVNRLRVFIIGDRAGDYSTAMHLEIERMPGELRERLVVEPETGEVPRYYRVADIALCTSRIESYPRIILEAMACGLPLITTPVFGIREQVQDNVNALIYEPGSVKALADALTSLVEDDERRAAFSIASRTVLSGLTTYHEMIEKYGQIFLEARFSRSRELALNFGMATNGDSE